MLDDLVTSLRLNGATIDVNETGGAVHRATIGDVSGDDELVLPLVLDEQLVGALTVWPRPGERLDGQTERALAALVPTVAVAAKLASTAEALATRAPASPSPATRSAAPCDANCTTGSGRRSPASPTG